MVVTPFDIAPCPADCACRQSPPPWDYVAAAVVIFFLVMFWVSL